MKEGRNERRKEGRKEGIYLIPRSHNHCTISTTQITTVNKKNIHLS